MKRFLLEGPRIVLERRKDGRGNWEGIGRPENDVSSKPSKEEKGIPESESAVDIPVKALAVGEFAITDGSVLWIDHINKERREMSDLTLRLEDVSLDRPIQLAARLLGRSDSSRRHAPCGMEWAGRVLVGPEPGLCV